MTDREPLLALIPARAGSARVPGKNTKLLGGHPLIGWTVAVARASGLFGQHVWVCTDDLPLLTLMRDGYGVKVFQRSPSTPDEPDIQWLTEFFREHVCGAFMLLRATSPFRTPDMLQEAWTAFNAAGTDSLRAVELWRGPHPGKMWTCDPERLHLHPVMDGTLRGVPYHSLPTQSLPAVYRQNASLEIGWAARTVRRDPPSLAGHTIAPFVTRGDEGFDINTPKDWEKAERLARDRVTYGFTVTTQVAG